jgi:hypothetical protein
MLRNVRSLFGEEFPVDALVITYLNLRRLLVGVSLISPFITLKTIKLLFNFSYVKTLLEV